MTEVGQAVVLSRRGPDRLLEVLGRDHRVVGPTLRDRAIVYDDIATVDDLKNLRLRTYDPTGVEVFSRVGAAPIQLSWADVVPQLTTGGIDAVLTSDEGGTNAKFWEHLSHFNQLGFSLGFSMGHMNRDVFEELSPELKEEVMAAASEAEDIAWDKAEGRVASNFETMRKEGIEIVEPTPELLDALQEAATPVLEEWQADMGPDGDAILEDYRAKVGS